MRLVNDPKIDRLADIRLFAGLSRRDRARIAAAADVATIPACVELTREGEPGDLMYVIHRGHVRVRRGETVLADLRDNDVVGELAVLDGGVRTATVETVTETEVFVFDRRHLGPLLDRTERLAGRLEAVADERRAA